MRRIRELNSYSVRNLQISNRYLEQILLIKTPLSHQNKIAFRNFLTNNAFVIAGVKHDIMVGIWIFIFATVRDLQSRTAIGGFLILISQASKIYPFIKSKVNIPLPTPRKSQALLNK